MHSIVIAVNIICFQAAKTLDHKCCHHKKKNDENVILREVWVNAMVVIIPQYMNVSNQHILHHKLIQC